MVNVLVLGTYDNGEEKLQNLHTSLFNQLDAKVNGRLSEHVNLYGPLKHSKTRVIQKVLPNYTTVVVVGLGVHKENDFNEAEELFENKDNVRKAISSAVAQVRSLDIEELEEIHFDACNDAEQVAIGAIVSDWVFDELKCEKLRRKKVKYLLADSTNAKDLEAFKVGSTIANMQNICRRFQELPANIMTPTRFAAEAKELCEPVGIKVCVHDRKWAEEKGMNSFLSVSNGSEQPPKFVELHYYAAAEKRPLVFVGKGITFDTGGISLKPSANMSEMRADMSGAAVVLTSIATLASIKAKVNVIGLIPLSENLISGKATKPGDVVFAMNGKSIQINNTDAEGRLVLADALCYADTFEPEVVVDIATLTGASKIALGTVAAAVMTTSTKYYEILKSAGSETGERVWRLPLFNDYAQQIKNPPLADLLNENKVASDGAGTITAGKFLQEFTKCKNWVHVDMANMRLSSADVYLARSNFSGRPFRTMVNFIRLVFSKL